jgi:hypothetical protein
MNFIFHRYTLYQSKTDSSFLRILDYDINNELIYVIEFSRPNEKLIYLGAISLIDLEKKLSNYKELPKQEQICYYEENQLKEKFKFIREYKYTYVKKILEYSSCYEYKCLLKIIRSILKEEKKVSKKEEIISETESESKQNRAEQLNTTFSDSLTIQSTTKSTSSNEGKAFKPIKLTKYILLDSFLKYLMRNANKNSLLPNYSKCGKPNEDKKNGQVRLGRKAHVETGTEMPLQDVDWRFRVK